MWQPQGFYSKFMLSTPIVLMGIDSIQELYTYPGKKFAIIHGSSLNNYYKELICKTFAKSSYRFFFKSWNNEPSIQDLQGTIKELEQYQPDVIIAVGGGSVIDGCKLCRLFYEFPFIENYNRIDGSDFRTKFLVIPTTIGSGSEVSSAAVYFNYEANRKEMFVIHELQPNVIVYDYKMIIGTPPNILAASILDGISHIIEGYVSNVSNEFIEILAEKGLECFHKSFNTSSIDFSSLQYSGFIGGIVQNHCIVGAAHAIAHQLSGYGFSHGVAVGLLLPTVIKQNCENVQVKEKYLRLVRNSNFKSLDELLEFIQSIIMFGKFGSRRDELKNILYVHFDEIFKNIIDDRGGKGNPLPITEEYVFNVIRSL